MTELGERLARGDRAAFAELYDACADRVHHYLLVRLASRADADDLLQESFVRLARTRRKLANVENPTAYWFAIARNESLRLLGRRSREAKGRAALDERALFCPPAGDRLEEREAQAQLATALSQLSDEQREAVELKIYAGLTLAEIAQITDAPLGTVATRYRSGIGKLRELLSEAMP